MASASANLHQGVAMQHGLRKDIDIHYPEPLSKHHRFSLTTEFPHVQYRRPQKKDMKRGNRHRTQPVTFDEIKEVDEENVDDAPSNRLDNVRLDLMEFSKSLQDGTPIRKISRQQSQVVGSNVLITSAEDTRSKEQ